MPAAMPPASSADNLEKRTVALPPSLWGECEGFSEKSGEKLSEVYRRIFTLGVSAEKGRQKIDREYDIQVLIQERLEAKHQGAMEALKELEAALAAGDIPSSLMDSVERFREWLSKG
jgi:hypothetical protein